MIDTSPTPKPRKASKPRNRVILEYFADDDTTTATIPDTIEAPTHIPRTADEWQVLLDTQMAKVSEMRIAGRKEAANHWERTFCQPLLNNVELARRSKTGTHTDGLYDASQWTLAHMRGEPESVPCRIIGTRVGSSAQNNDDTEGAETSVQAEPLTPSADNNPAKTETVANINDTIATPTATIEQIGTNGKFTKFTLPPSPHVRSFPTPDGLRQQMTEASAQVATAKPAPPADVTWETKIELMEGLLRSIQVAVFDGDLPGVETMFHEFQHELYRATRRSKSLVTMARSQVMARLECREPEELPEPIDNIRQLPLLDDSGEAA